MFRLVVHQMNLVCLKRQFYGDSQFYWNEFFLQSHFAIKQKHIRDVFIFKRRKWKQRSKKLLQPQIQIKKIEFEQNFGFTFMKNIFYWRIKKIRNSVISRWKFKFAPCRGLNQNSELKIQTRFSFLQKPPSEMCHPPIFNRWQDT